MDSLHLFIRISDVLINPLIHTGWYCKSLQINKVGANFYKHIQFLNKEYKILFQCFTDKEPKKLTWHDSKKNKNTNINT